MRGGLNLYSYVDNNPIGLTDPLGLQARLQTPSRQGMLNPSPSGGKGKCCDDRPKIPEYRPIVRDPGYDPQPPMIGLQGPRPSGPPWVMIATLIGTGIGAWWVSREPESGGKVLPFRKPSPSPSPSPSPCSTPTPNTGKPGEWCNLKDQTGKICTYECPSGGTFTWFLNNKGDKCPPWKKVTWP